MESLAHWESEANANSSLLHRLDARVKIICAIGWSFLLSSLTSIQAALVALAVSLVLILIARWPWRNLVKRLAVVNIFILFMWLTLPFSFSSPGQVVGTLGPLDITREGLDLAILLTIKSNAIVIAMMALLSTSPLFILAVAGRRLHFPEKLVNLFLLTTRYCYVMFQEYQRLRIAMRARAFEARLNKNTINGLANLVGSLLVRSFDRADRVHRAMLCRGYTGTIWVKAEFSFNPKEFSFSVLMLFLGVAVGGMEWMTI